MEDWILARSMVKVKKDQITEELKQPGYIFLYIFIPTIHSNLRRVAKLASPINPIFITFGKPNPKKIIQKNTAPVGTFSQKSGTWQ